MNTKDLSGLLNNSEWMSKDCVLWLKTINSRRGNTFYDLSHNRNHVALIERSPQNTVKLLLPLSNNLNDASVYNTITTAYGNASYSTAQSKWGAGSAYFDGLGDYLTAPYGSHYLIGNNPFTVEMWYRPTSLSGNWCLMSNNGNDNWNGAIGFEGNSTNLWFIVGNTPTMVGDAHGMSADNWYFIQANRDTSNEVRLRINGTQIGSTVNVSTNLNATNEMTIGNRYISGQGGWVRSLSGYVSDLRLTIGATQSSTTPATAFSTSFPRGYAWETAGGRGMSLHTGYYYSNLTTINGMASGAVPRTVMLWFKMANSSDINRMLLQVGSGDTLGRRFAIFRGVGTLSAESVGDGVEFNWAGDTLWHHLAIVQTGTTTNSVLMYLDGVQKSTIGGTSNTLQPDNQIAIAQLTHALGTHDFHGLLDDIRIYNRALNSIEIKDVYQDSWGMLYSGLDKINYSRMPLRSGVSGMIQAPKRSMIYGNGFGL